MPRRPHPYRLALPGAVALFALTAVLADSASASAADDTITDTVTAWAGIDLATAGSGVTTNHGIVLLAWGRTGLSRDARLHLELNTDTLLLDYGGHRLSDTLRFGVRLKGEVHFGNMLPDFFVAGEKIDRYGVSASFVELAPRLKYSPADHHFFTFEVAFQGWFLRHAQGLIGDGTDERMVIPDPLFIVRPRLDYAYWNPGNDPSNWEQHRPFPRLRGVAAGLSLGVDVRQNHERWGYLEGASAVAVLQRNDPDAAAWWTRGWLRWGAEPADALRVQGSAAVGVGAGGDDITRPILGGQNPYVVRIPGVGWAGFLTETYAQSDVELRGTVGETHEIGVGASTAGVTDPGRLDRFREWAAIPSLYALADLRFGAWQLDARAAWAAETRWSGHGPHFGVFVSLGRAWTL